MGLMVSAFVERYAEDGWHEERALRAALEMDFVNVVRKKRSLVNRGIPNDVSTGVEEGLSELGEEFASESWATLEELLRLPLEGMVEERRLLGPHLWRQYREKARRMGSEVNEKTPALLERFGARLVSNEEMDAYVQSPACEAETRGVTDGQCKVFTILAHSRSLADQVGFAPTLDAMRMLGTPDSVRVVWTIGP